MSLPDKPVQDMAGVQRNFDAVDAVLSLAGDLNPENLVTADPGRLYVNRTEPATLWLKATGKNTNTGWVLK